MTTRSWLSKVFGWKTQRTSRGSRRGGPRPRAKTPLQLEALEDRLTPSAYDAWMGYLPDNVSLAQISIPGTHDTMTSGVWGVTIPHVAVYAQTQTMTLTQQLNAGIRYLDIRVGLGGTGTGDLGLYHGDVSLGMSFNTDVVKTCEDFLTAHPLETIVMSIQNDHCNWTDVDPVVAKHVSGPDAKFWYASQSVPDLKDVRGKIVVINSWYYTLPITVGIDGHSKEVFDPSIKYEVTDAVALKDVVSEVWTVAKAHLDMAQSTPISDAHWFVTNTNCNLPTPGDCPLGIIVGQVLNFVDPATIAEGLGDVTGINELLSGQTFNGRVGTVVTDFVRPSFINKVIGANVFNVAPTDIALSNAKIPENTPFAVNYVGDFSTTDPNPIGSHSYTLVSGDGDDDNAAFSISDDGKLLTKQSFDREDKSFRSIRVRSTDDGLQCFEKKFTIDITDVDEAPTDITLSGNSVAENLLHGIIGSFSTTDPDPGDSFTYSLFNMLDDSQFSIANGVLSNNATFDFEAKSSYSIVVRSTDKSGLHFDQFFKINVTNVNEAPTAHDMTVKTTQNTPITFTVNATDPEGDASVHSFYSVDGAVAFVPGQPLEVTYTPPSNRIGTFQFGYDLRDSSNNSSNQALITVIVQGPPAVIGAVSGDGQSAQAGTELFGQPLVVRVADSAGNPLAGVGVTFTSPSAQDGGFFVRHITTFTATTDANGRADVLFKPGFLVGTYTVTAAVDGVPGLSTGFTLTNVGPPASIGAVSGDGQSAQVGTPFFSQPLVVRVADSAGHPLPGVGVTFTSPSALDGTIYGAFFGSFATTFKATTDANGRASAEFIPSGRAGAYTVTAAVDGVPQLSTGFTLTNTPGAPHHLAATGDGQAVEIGLALATPLSVTVLDRFNNPIPQAEVDFTAPATGPSGTFGGQTTAAVLTGASGVAVTPTFTANSASGAYTVTATVAGTSLSTTFALTNVKATPAVIAMNAGGTYNGLPYAATAKVTNSPGVVLASDASSPPADPGTLSYRYYLASDGTRSAPLSGAPVHVGSYQVVAHYTSDRSGYTDADSAPVSFAITPAKLTVTANNASRTYGAANPTFTAAITGFQNGETLTTSGVTGTPGLGTTASATSNVGTYPIAVGLGDLHAGNYDFDLVNGTLIITPAPLTVTADNASKVYGQDNAAALTGTISGIRNNDAITAVFSSLGAGVGAAPGTYAVDAMLSDGNSGKLANYNVTIVPAMLTVSKDSTTARVASPAGTVNFGQDVTFAATVTANAPGSGTPTGTVSFYDGTALLGTVPLSGGTATFTAAKLASGDHNITITYGGNGDFLGSSSATLTQTVLSALEQAKALGDQVTALVKSGVLSSQDANGLTPKLNAAAASLNAGNIKAGVNQLNAFINQVLALVNSRRLSKAQAQTLIDAANEAIASALA